MTHTPVATPNHPPVPHPPEQTPDDPFEFLSADAIQELRDAQKAHIQGAINSVANPYDLVGQKQAEENAKADFDALRTEYLQDKWGVRESDPRYDEYYNIISQASVDNMDDHAWMAGEFDKDGNPQNPSGRQMLNDLHDKELDDYQQTLTPPVPPVPPMPAPSSDSTQILHTPEQLRDYTDKVDARNEAHANLVNARDKLAALTVKRQGKLADGRTQDYRDAHSEYNDAVIAFGKAGEAMKDAADHRRTDDQRNSDIAEYLLHEAAELRRITNEKWDNTTVNKICKWMARGNIAQRIAKGVLVGGVVAGGAAIITAATAGTGTVGIIAGGAAAGGGMLSRGMRAYGAIRGRQLLEGKAETSMTGTDAFELTSVSNMFERDVYAEVRTSGLEAAAGLLHEGHERAIQAEQKKNRRATFMSVGAIAIGAGAAEGIHLVAEHSTHYTGRLAGAWDRVRGFFGNQSDTKGMLHVPETPDVPDTVEPTPGAVDHVTAEQFNAMATVDKGMGGIELFKEMGLGANDWYKHEDALLKAHPNDFYRMSDGHVGLKHPGKLSEGTMRDIAQRTGIWQK